MSKLLDKNYKITCITYMPDIKEIKVSENSDINKLPTSRIINEYDVGMNLKQAATYLIDKFRYDGKVIRYQKGIKIINGKYEYELLTREDGNVLILCVNHELIDSYKRLNNSFVNNLLANLKKSINTNYISNVNIYFQNDYVDLLSGKSVDIFIPKDNPILIGQIFTILSSKYKINFKNNNNIVELYLNDSLSCNSVPEVTIKCLKQLLGLEQTKKRILV